MSSVTLDAGKTALGPTGGHYSGGGSGYCSLIIDVSLGQTNWSMCETDGMVGCWLIVSWFICRLWIVVHKTFSSLFFLQILFTSAPFGMPEVHLKETCANSPSCYQYLGS